MPLNGGDDKFSHVVDSNSITPLLAVKERLEHAIAGYLDGVAALRKRLAAIDTAIDVLRSSDDTLLLEAPRQIRQVIEGKKRIINFDEAAVERAALLLLADGPLGIADLAARLHAAGHTFSEYGLKRILKTSPAIESIGQREKTKYQLSEPARARA